MNEKPPRPAYEQKATILRERAFFATFIGLLFALATNGALFLLDQGISILRGAKDWREALVALVLLLVGASVIGLTGLLLIAALQNIRLAWKMEREGQVTSGKVLKKELRQNGSKYLYQLVYGLNEEIRFIERIPESEYQRLNVGDAVELRFLPGHPDIARLEKIK